jgi:hypothetical protein
MFWDSKSALARPRNADFEEQQKHYCNHRVTLGISKNTGKYAVFLLSLLEAKMRGPREEPRCIAHPQLSVTLPTGRRYHTAGRRHIEFQADRQHRINCACLHSELFDRGILRLLSCPARFAPRSHRRAALRVTYESPIELRQRGRARRLAPRSSCSKRIEDPITLDVVTQGQDRPCSSLKGRVFSASIPFRLRASVGNFKGGNRRAQTMSYGLLRSVTEHSVMRRSANDQYGHTSRQCVPQRWRNGVRPYDGLPSTSASRLSLGQRDRPRRMCTQFLNNTLPNFTTPSSLSVVRAATVMFGSNRKGTLCQQNHECTGNGTDVDPFHQERQRSTSWIKLP